MRDHEKYLTEVTARSFDSVFGSVDGRHAWDEARYQLFFFQNGQRLDAKHPIECTMGIRVFITSRRNLQLQDIDGFVGMEAYDYVDQHDATSYWTISDAGDGSVFITSHRTAYLTDLSGTAHLSSENGESQKWIISDAGSGEVFITSYRSVQLKNRGVFDSVGVEIEWGSWQKWNISTTSWHPACGVQALILAIGNVCPIGRERLRSQNACQEAASALGMDFLADAYISDWPSGCYKPADADGLWYNHYQTGGAGPDGLRLVCAVPRATTSTTTQASSCSHCYDVGTNGYIRDSKVGCLPNTDIGHEHECVMNGYGCSAQLNVYEKCPSLACTLVDSDSCLNRSSGWGGFTCNGSAQWCTSWAKDVQRCCPNACGTGILSYSQCNALGSQGTCTYPNGVQICQGLYYIYGVADTKACPTFSDGILSAGECESAASSMGLTWKGANNSADYPKGCYSYGEGSGTFDGVHFNSHSEGNQNLYSTPICAYQASGCIWEQGSGTGGTSQAITLPDNVSQWTRALCLQEVRSRCPSANGVKFVARQNDNSCYCIVGQTGRIPSATWQNCMFETSTTTTMAPNTSAAPCVCNRVTDGQHGDTCAKHNNNDKWCYVDEGACTDEVYSVHGYWSELACVPTCVCNGATDGEYGQTCTKHNHPNTNQTNQKWCYVDQGACTDEVYGVNGYWSELACVAKSQVYCTDIKPGKRGKAPKYMTCDDYVKYTSLCDSSENDAEDFSAAIMCCACGGGTKWEDRDAVDVTGCASQSASCMIVRYTLHGLSPELPYKVISRSSSSLNDTISQELSNAANSNYSWWHLLNASFDDSSVRFKDVLEL